MKHILLLSLTALSLVAQDAKPAEAPKAPKAEAGHEGHAHAAPKAEAPKANKVVAIIGQDVIRQSDLDAVIEAMPAQQRAQLDGNPGVRSQYLQAYLDSRLLAVKARKDGLNNTPAFRSKVAQAEEQLLASELVMRDGKGLEAKAILKDEDLKAYYEKNKARFAVPDKFSARHILVSVKAAAGDKKAVTEDEAKATVAKIQAELKAGKTFDELAKTYSDDPGSKDKGGLYEDFDPAMMVAEFAQAVRTQPLNQVGEPVKTQFGYHLIEVTKKTPGSVPPFEQVKDQVTQALTPERRQQVWKDYLEGLKKEIPVITGDAAEAAAKMLPKTAAKAPKAAKTKGGAK